MKRFLFIITTFLAFLLLPAGGRAQSNQTVTNGGGTAPVNFPGTGCIYNWVNDNPAVGLPAKGTGNIASFTAVNTGNTPVSATITATPAAAGFIYIANEGGFVTALNTATNTVSGTINFGPSVDPFGCAASPDGSRVYVTDAPYASVSVINTANNAIIATIAVGIEPKYAIVSPDGSKVYVANRYSNTISVINTATNTVSATIAGVINAYGLAFSPDGSKLYVTGSGITIINTANNTIAATSSVDASGAIVISPDGGTIYVENGDGISVINASTSTISATIPLSVFDADIALSHDGSRLYVSNNAFNTITVINTGTNKVIDIIYVGLGANGLCLSHDGSHLYVINADGSVTVIYTPTDLITAIAQTGQRDNFSFGNFVTGNAVCTGGPVKFTITVNPNTSPFITSSTVAGNTFACMGSPSSSPYIGQFKVSGIKLTNDIEVTAPPAFEVSLAAASGYGNIVTVPQSGGIVDSTIVYVRSSASAPAGHISGSLTISSAGAVSQNETVYGFVNLPAAINPVFNQTVNNNTATAAVNFIGASSISWTNDTPGIGLPSNGTGNIASFTAINNGTVPVTATITATPMPASYAYIVYESIGTVSVINTMTNTVVATIPTGANGASSAVVSHDGTRVYVANENDNVVTVINAVTNAVIAKVPVGSIPQTIVVSADDSKVYVTNTYSNTISVISAATNTVTATLTTNVEPRRMCLSADGTRIYSECDGNGNITVIDIASNTIIATIETGFNAQGMALSPDGSLLYVPAGITETTSDSTRIRVFSTVTFTLVRTFDVNHGTTGLAESPDGSRLYLISENPSYLSVINTANSMVIATIPVGSSASGVSVTGDGSQVYVENQLDNTVSVISTATNTVTATIPVGQSPGSYDSFTSFGITCGVTPVKFTITVNPFNALSPVISTTNVSGNIISCAGTASASPDIEQFNVTGINLTGNVTATAPAGFEVSLTAEGVYGNSVILAQVGGTLSSTVVYVRSAVSLQVGTTTANVLLSSPGAAGQSVSVTGIINPMVTTSVVISASVNNVCVGTPVSFTATPNNGGSSPVYQWLLNGNNAGMNSPTFSSTFANGDVVSCTMTSDAPCAAPTAVTSNQIVMVVGAPPVVDAGGNKTIAIGKSVVLNATAPGNITDITWSPATGLSNYKILNPVASPSLTTTYTLTVQTQDGCMGSDTATVQVTYPIIIPNTFTPNGDGKNDTWDIKYLNTYSNCKVQIFNRWGQRLYSSTGYNIPWDGTYKGSAVPSGTYYYIIDLMKNSTPLAGFVMVIR